MTVTCTWCRTACELMMHQNSVRISGECLGIFAYYVYCLTRLLSWSCTLPGPMWVLVLNLMFCVVCKTSFLLWYVKCLEKGLHALCSKWNTIMTWDHAKRHFSIVNCNCKWQKSLGWKPRSWCHNVNGTYWSAAEHRRHLFLSLDILHIHKSSQYHLSNNIKAWELKLLVLCPRTAILEYSWIWMPYSNGYWKNVLWGIHY
jgi:hypothetical protein